MLTPPLYCWSHTDSLGMTMVEERTDSDVACRDTGAAVLYVSDDEDFQVHDDADISFALFAATVARAKAVLADLADASREDV